MSEEGSNDFIVSWREVPAQACVDLLMSSALSIMSVLFSAASLC